MQVWNRPRWARLLIATTLLWTPLAAVRGEETAKVDAAAIEAVEVRLSSDRMLRGVIRTPRGEPSPNTAVVLGVQGKPLRRTRTDAAGRFAFGPLDPGQYQVATKDAAAMLLAYTREQAPASAEGELEVSRRAMIARGQNPAAVLTHPWFIGLAVAAAVAIPVGIALGDDDDAS
jgi:hypothetical protein